jgi:hypothetical protein
MLENQRYVPVFSDVSLDSLTPPAPSDDWRQKVEAQKSIARDLNTDTREIFEIVTPYVYSPWQRICRSDYFPRSLQLRRRKKKFLKFSI